MQINVGKIRKNNRFYYVFDNNSQTTQLLAIHNLNSKCTFFTSSSQIMHINQSYFVFLSCFFLFTHPSLFLEELNLKKRFLFPIGNVLIL